MYNPVCFGTFDCSLNWGAMIVLFFIAAVLRRQLNDNAGVEFSMIGGTILGVLGYIIVYFIFGSLKYGFLGGLVGVFVGGFLGSQFLGDGSVE